MAETAERRARARSTMLREVADGLSRPQPELSPKWFYDARGSALFDRITELPEYYLTRAERGLLDGWARRWVGEFAPASMVELGPGAADKTRILLDAMCGRGVYVPVDISRAYLETITTGLSADYPDLDVRPLRADLAGDFTLPADLPHPTLVAFLGSTIGNFAEAAAHRLLGRVRVGLRHDDRFLMGTDLRKDAAVLEAAYNDAEGVTAEFNLNVLRVLNRELGADFDFDAWDHQAFYESRLGRVEMHVVSRRRQTVHLPGVGAFEFEPGDTIRTEISTKYDRATVERLFSAAGLALDAWQVDGQRRFALAVGRRA